MGRFSDFGLGMALQTELTDSGSQGVAQTNRGTRGYESDAVAYEGAAMGQGGVTDATQGCADSYPTTPDDALLADLAPLDVGYCHAASRDQIVYYIVENNDTISQIAQHFGLDPSTVVWANSLSAESYIQPGQKLTILPVDGIQYTVAKGDTANTLAKKFNASADDIVAYNRLPADGSLRPGDALMIPGGSMPVPPRPKPTIIAGSQLYAMNVNTNQYFIFPTTGRKSQGLHYNNAVDIANECGTPVYAAADGVVTTIDLTNSRARVGNAVYGGYGNHIEIKHPNGLGTLYAHLESVYVFEGQTVRQGSMIALMGGGFELVNGRLVRMEGAGRSSGCHLHFEVHGARNPLQ